ncbi:alcohol dehydrogenase catalytic domain-containing protein [Streptomyces sp. NBC_00287]|uniref:alcohol dehydrogenase catalytic domain-containing protein n=1 Tax=Streptomyces sp. NBC_00287 TaxID=2975702 RepID=UPI002E2A4C28|nr:alcohol dehydrogenase catalytic domain-containing protein [Streptomyces sp. NBC_00287]
MPPTPRHRALTSHTDRLVCREAISVHDDGDLHIYQGNPFSPELGYTPGHECVGVVVDTGNQVTRFKPGDRVLVPASAGCTLCRSCAAGFTARCERAKSSTELCYGVSPQLPGSQAQALSVPYADINLVPLPEGISDEAAVVLTDNAPTAWYGCRRARIQPGETVLVIGLGPVGLMAAQSAFAMGAARVLGADLVAERRAFAAGLGVEPVEGEDAKAAVRDTEAVVSHRFPSLRRPGGVRTVRQPLRRRPQDSPRPHRLTLSMRGKTGLPSHTGAPPGAGELLMRG